MHKWSGLKPLDIINPVHIYMYLKLPGLQCYFLLTHFPLRIYQKTRQRAKAVQNPNVYSHVTVKYRNHTQESVMWLIQ